jgi:purine-nucleoside/S-methyl-5'-thioadenosine phosphorylase / adenosine deaminase
MTEPQPNRAFEWTQAPWGRVLRCIPLAAIADHLFTTRPLTLREDPSEWQAVATRLGVARDDILLVRQVHEARVAAASADRARPWPTPEADVIVSNDPAAAVGVRVADCAAVLIASTDGRGVAAVHAGWRGTAGRAVIAGVAALQERYGVRPERTIAAIGPCLGPCCCEVGEDVRTAFRDAGHHQDLLNRWFDARPSGKFHLDLWRATRDQLEGAGVMPSSIHAAELCTKTHPDVLHSYRVDGSRAGRMLAAIRARA